MAHASVSKEMPATQDAVWKVLSDPRRFEEWLTLHSKWKSDPPAELQQGAQMSEVVTIMEMPNTIDWTVQEYTVPRSMKISGTGMAGAEVTFTLSVEPRDDGGSVATIDAEFISQMMVGAIGGAIERNAVTELETSLEQLAGLAG